MRIRVIDILDFLGAGLTIEEVLEETPDLDAPIELGEEWPPSGTAAAHPPAGTELIDIGVLVPGQDRTVDLPVTATVNGRPVRLSLRVTVRLSR